VATEPIIWQDGAWEAFATALADCGVRTLVGGRFIHLMGANDKSDGLRTVKQHFGGAITVALGDSPNDEAMLSAADIAVVIPNAHSPTIAPTAPRVIYADFPGPAGWNEAILSILDQHTGDT
jgi:mannosyl-3-phosphoglycerate phosphatase